jgi:hypothetical protein
MKIAGKTINRQSPGLYEGAGGWAIRKLKNRWFVEGPGVKDETGSKTFTEAKDEFAKYVVSVTDDAGSEQAATVTSGGDTGGSSRLPERVYGFIGRSRCREDDHVSSSPHGTKPVAFQDGLAKFWETVDRGVQFIAVDAIIDVDGAGRPTVKELPDTVNVRPGV